MGTMETRFLIGIDEAGRGPLAGPVAVGAVLIPFDFAIEQLSCVRDSKQLSEKKREEWYEKMLALEQNTGLRVAVSFAPASLIDKKGIVPAIRSALLLCLEKLEAKPHECRIVLDGSLYAPSEFIHQETIIRGDQTEPLISAASIAAKVLRDRYMTQAAEKYPGYGFEIHKGYGTALHRNTITNLGPSLIHRKSFCKNLLTTEK